MYKTRILLPILLFVGMGVNAQEHKESEKIEATLNQLMQLADDLAKASKDLVDVAQNINNQDITQGHSNRLNQELDPLNADGVTDLMLVAAKGTAEEIESEIKRAKNIFTRDKNGDTALIWAINGNNLPGVLALIKHSPALVNIANKKNTSPLFVSCYHGDFNIISALLQAGAQDSHMSKSDLNNPIAHALSSGSLDKVNKALADKKAKNFINKTDKQGLTPLHFAFMYGYPVEIIQRIIALGGNLQKTTKDQHTCLMFAIQHNRPIADIQILFGNLLEQEINKTDFCGNNVLNYAVRHIQNPSTMQYLLEHNANVHNVNVSDESLLNTTVKFKNAPCLRLLLQQNSWSAHELNKALKEVAQLKKKQPDDAAYKEIYQLILEAALEKGKSAQSKADKNKAANNQQSAPQESTEIAEPQSMQQQQRSMVIHDPQQDPNAQVKQLQMPIESNSQNLAQQDEHNRQRMILLQDQEREITELMDKIDQTTSNTQTLDEQLRLSNGKKKDQLQNKLSNARTKLKELNEELDQLKLLHITQRAQLLELNLAHTDYMPLKNQAMENLAIQSHNQLIKKHGFRAWQLSLQQQKMSRQADVHNNRRLKKLLLGTLKQTTFEHCPNDWADIERALEDRRVQFQQNGE